MSEPTERREVQDLRDVEVRINAAVLEALVTHKDLSGTELRMLLFALSMMNPTTGVAHITREDMAREARAGTAYASRATTKLKALGLLWRLDNGRVQVNPNFAFRGETRVDWMNAIQDLPGDAPAIRIPTSPPAEHSTSSRKKSRLRLVK